MAQKKKPSRIGKAILEMAADQHRIGVMDDAAYREIALRNREKTALAAGEPPSANPTPNQVQR